MMTFYDEKTGMTLLDGVAGAIAVSRINGMVPSSWPVALKFGRHELQIAQDGTLTLAHDGPLSENPALGERVETGEFSFHVTDGAIETGPRIASVDLNGIAVPPLSMRFRANPVTEGAPPGTVLGVIEAVATGHVSFTLEASSLPAEIVGTELRATAPVPAGPQSATVRAENAVGTLSRDLSLPGPSLIHRGQHDPALPAFAGPLGGETEFYSPRGAVLHPTGNGRWVYVDASASGAEDGTSSTDAYTTIQAAIDDHRAGDCILVEPGLYVEDVHDGVLRGPAPNPYGYTKENEATASDRVKICRRGAGRVEITATDPLRGWVKCVSGDADNNPNWPNLWKKTFTPSNRSLSLNARALVQGGEMAFLRVSGDGYTTTDQMFSQNDSTKWWDSGNSGMSGTLSDGVLTLTSAAVFGSYSAGNLDDAILVAQFTPGNNTVQEKILSHTPEANQITASFSRSNYGDGVVLLNVARHIDGAGQWAYKDNGDGSYSIFFWPYDNTKMDEIRITERENVLNTDAAENWTFYGLDFTGPGGKDQHKGVPIRSSQNTALVRSGLHFEECRGTHYVSVWGIGIDMARCTGLKLFNCTFEYGVGGKGISVIQSPGAWTDQCLVANVGNTGVNLSTAYEQVFSYSEIRNVRSTHGNGMSIYQGAEKVVVWGNKISTGGGIGMTNQSSANLWIGMNLVTAPQGDIYGHRAIENNSTYPPVHYGENMPFSGVITYLNNSVPPWKEATGGESITGMITGKTSHATHNACNNVSMGGIDPTLYGSRDPEADVAWNGGTYNATIGRYADNIVIRQGMLQGPFFSSGNNTRVVNPRDVFNDYASGDYRPKIGGAGDGSGGGHSDLLPSGAWIDWFDFDRDLEGRSFDWAVNAPRGALLSGA